MINQLNVGKSHYPGQLAHRYFSQSENFRLLKLASIHNPVLFYQYAQQQYYHKALANHYKAMAAGGGVSHRKTSEIGPKQNQSQQAESKSRSLLDALRNGGYILYARHAEATVGADQQNYDLQDCATQRNLSEYGRRQAVTYGEGLRSIEIPVNYPVEASPFCRTIETARLAFGEDNVLVEPFWVNIYHISELINTGRQQRVLNYLQSVLETYPPAGSNKVIISHSFPSRVGLGRIPNMGTVIVRPHGQGNGYDIVAKLTLSELTELRT
ncbi:histidine phosphatase family protein [Salipaludibacillus sp. HK11]|uniref:histidine phosphatase family protein n=1 Tax=Salipaludibacillus sp. HK11 TaxID=3394320 RepID=UPI0039FD0EEF